MPKKLPVSETAQEDYALIIREIKAQLGRLGWSDAEFARRFGVSQPAMQRRMSCATECTATELIDMCIVLGVSLATIVDDAKRHRP
jgi:ribosome-binding protein aMBF1 (putative translation factor)